MLLSAWKVAATIASVQSFEHKHVSAYIAVRARTQPIVSTLQLQAASGMQLAHFHVAASHLPGSHGARFQPHLSERVCQLLQ